MSADLPVLTVDVVKDALRRAAVGADDPVRATWHCPELDFLPCVRLLQEGGARLLTLAAMREEGDDLVLTYTFELGRGSYLVIGTPTRDRTVGSLFSFFASADFLEREVNLLFGVKFLGHPNLPHPVRGEPTP